VEKIRLHSSVGITLIPHISTYFPITRILPTVLVLFILLETYFYYRRFKITIEADHNAITKFQFMKLPFSRQNDDKTSHMLVDLWTSFSSNGLRDFRKC